MAKSKTGRKTLPATIYVKIEDDGSGDHYLTAGYTPREFAVANDSIKVGVYRLERIALIEAPVEVR